MAAIWGEVLTLLESGKRRHKDGRTLVQVWADAVLDDPASAFAFVNEHVLPKEQELQPNQQLNSIQNLYLTAVQQAARMPAPAIEHEDDW
jgi:hypothetical protein